MFHQNNFRFQAQCGGIAHHFVFRLYDTLVASFIFIKFFEEFYYEPLFCKNINGIFYELLNKNL